MGRDRLLKQALRDRFLVTLKSGAAFDGLLDEWDHSHVVLVDAGSIVDVAGGRQRVPIQGQVWLPRAEVDYMQRLPQ